MRIGVPKEIKTNENRVALVPAGAEALTASGHQVFIETGAGIGSGFEDDAYRAVGAEIVPDAATAWGKAELLLKVKEPIEKEWGFLRRLLPLRGRRDAHERAPGQRRHVHCVRNGRTAQP